MYLGRVRSLRPWALLVALFLLLGLAAAELVRRELDADLAASRQAAEQQLHAGAAMVAAELGQGDYQNIGVLFDAWGHYSEDIVALKLTASNGFLLAEFSRPARTVHLLPLQVKLSYSYHGEAELQMTVSQEPTYQRQRVFVAGFAAILCVLAILSSLLLHFALRSRAHWRRAERASRLYMALSEVNQAIVRMERQQELFPLVCRCAVEFGGMRMAWVGQLDDDGEHIVPVAVHGEASHYLDGLRISSRPDLPEGRGPSGTAYRENRPVIVNDFQAEPGTRPWRAKAAAAGWAASATFPITRKGRPCAVLSVYHDQAGAFDREAIALLGEMSMDVSFALDNFEREGERRAAEDSLRLAASVYDCSSEGILVTDAEHRILAVNPAYSRITGRTAREALGQPLGWLGWAGRDQPWQESMWRRVASTGRWSGEVQDQRQDGSRLHLWVNLDTVFGAQGEVLRRVVLMQDISESKEAMETIWRQANFDALTGLPNRQMFREYLKQEVVKSDWQGQGLALMFLNLDRFQEVNDALGHASADQLLAQVADRLRTCMPEAAMLARLGADEFGVVMTGVEFPQRLDHTADEILRAIAIPFRCAGEEVYLTSSIGITLYPADASDDSGLMRNADQALHAAKAAGRNRYNFFTPAMQQASLARLQVARSLRGALAADQFRLAWQPIVDLSDGRIHKAEALIRWEHPEHGLVGPGQFIAVAEDIGLIAEIGDWVFREATLQAAAWRRAFDPQFQVSINKSPVQFLQPQHRPGSWPAHLAQIGLPGSSVVIEITENVLLEASPTVFERLRQLREAGLQLSLDDFGTGYSSLSYLKRFDIDFVKIDQSFIRNLAPGSDDMALCEAIIVMAHKLGIRVVAEGIETAQQLALLAAAGCDFGQGYLFSRPVPAEAFEALLRQGVPSVWAPLQGNGTVGVS